MKGVCHVSRTSFSLYVVRRICIEVAVSLTNTKYFFVKKKSSAARKLTANNEQCTATHSSRFCQQYFIWRKNNFVPYLSCSGIVYSGLFTHLQHGFASREKNFAILLHFDGSSADWSKYITSSCKINAPEVDGSLWPTASCTEA